MLKAQNILFLFITSFSLFGFAQSTSTDCPTWGNKKKTGRDDYLEYMRKSQGKKESPKKENAVNNQQSTIKSNTDTVQYASKARTDFYTKKRYSVIGENTKANTTKEPVKAKVESKTQPQSVETVAVEKDNIIPPGTSESANGDPSLITPASSREEVVLDKEEGKGQVEKEEKKKQPTKLQKKMNRVFSKKTNKPTRPNYRKCSTRF